MVYTRQKTGASRQLFLVDKSVRLDDNVRGKPTDPTTPVAVPAAAHSSDTAGQKAARERYEATAKLVQIIYDERRDKSIAKDIRSDVLGAKDVRFKASDKDKARLGPLRIAECEVRLQESEDTRVAQAKRIADLEYLVRNGSGSLSKATTNRPGGFRPGGGPLKNAKVAFDRTTRTAKMECPRCPGQHHSWYQCQNKDKGVEHQPTNREVKTMALVQIFNDAAQAGAGAMRACIEQHGDPLVLEDGVVLPRQRRDLSYLGFTVERSGSGGEDTDSDFGDDDAPASFVHVSLCQPVVPRANALLAGAAAPQRSVQPYVGGCAGPNANEDKCPGVTEGAAASWYAEQERIDEERMLAAHAAIRRQGAGSKQQDALGQLPAEYDDFFGGFSVEPAAERDVAGQLLAPGGGEIGCEPCVQEISAAPARPMGCGKPPLGASQRLIWTVCMLCLCVGTVGAFAHLAYEHPAADVT
eukprot:gene26944-33130_t